MTDFGRRAGEGDMSKGVYDTDEDGVVDLVVAHGPSHQNAGSDEIAVDGLSGELADLQEAKAHGLGGVRHVATNLAGLNAKVSDATLDDSSAARTPAAHKTSHQDGGSDKINIAGLSGKVDYVDRGDPQNLDFTISNFTTDGNWHELDLSSIVPAGATVVHLSLNIKDDTVASWLIFTKNGNSYVANRLIGRTFIANFTTDFEGFCACDVDRKIQYKAIALTWNDINLTVKGWFI